MLSLTSQARSNGRVGTTSPADDAHAEPGTAIAAANDTDNRMFAPVVSQTSFNGCEGKYRVRMSKLTIFIAVKRSSGLPWVSWATKIPEAITEEDIHLEFGESSGDIKLFSAELQHLMRRRGEDPEATLQDAQDVGRCSGEGRGAPQTRREPYRRRMEDSRKNSDNGQTRKRAARQEEEEAEDIRIISRATGAS